MDIAETVRTDKRIGASNYGLAERLAWVYCPFGVKTRLLDVFIEGKAVNVPQSFAKRIVRQKADREDVPCPLPRFYRA